MHSGSNLHTDNDDFFGGNRLSQDPLYSLQGHVIYGFRSGSGLRSMRRTLQAAEQRSMACRTATTAELARRGLAFPVDRQNSIKFYASKGVSARTGNNYDLIGVAWQYRLAVDCDALERAHNAISTMGGHVLAAACHVAHRRDAIAITSTSHDSRRSGAARDVAAYAGVLIFALVVVAVCFRALLRTCSATPHRAGVGAEDGLPHQFAQRYIAILAKARVKVEERMTMAQARTRSCCRIRIRESTSPSRKAALRDFEATTS
jgi:hypothetical protein